MRDIKRWRGFTLLEVIVVVAIVGILTAVAVPSFSTVFNGSRLSTQANELVVAIQTARSEAVRSNRPVRVCGVAAQGGTTCNSGTGYWVVLGTDASGATTLVREFAIKAPAVITVGANLADGIIFGSDGIARKADGSLSNGDIVVCIPTRHPKENKRRVSIASGLRVNVSATGNGDGSC